MDYKERYIELLEKYKLLETRLNSLRSDNPEGKDTRSKEGNEGHILDEILEMVNIYLAIFSNGDDGRFYLDQLNRKAEEVESILQSEETGKCVENTPLAGKVKLIELLHHVNITGDAHKLAASESGDDSEGYYTGPGNRAIARKILKIFISREQPLKSLPTCSRK